MKTACVACCIALRNMFSVTTPIDQCALNCQPLLLARTACVRCSIYACEGSPLWAGTCTERRSRLYWIGYSAWLALERHGDHLQRCRRQNSIRIISPHYHNPSRLMHRLWVKTSCYCHWTRYVHLLVFHLQFVRLFCLKFLYELQFFP